MDRYLRYYPVSDKVPMEFRPLMAAFMSYFLRTNFSQGKSNNNSEHVRRVEPMIWRLLVFLFELDDVRQQMWKKKYSKDGKRKRFDHEGRREMIRNLIRKKDGSFMTSIEQLEFFAEAAKRHGHNIVCILFKDKHTQPLKTRGIKSNYFDVPVIQMSNDNYAATSNNEVFGFILVQKPPREKIPELNNEPLNFESLELN